MVLLVLLGFFFLHLEDAGLVDVAKARVRRLQVVERVSHVPLRRKNDRLQPIRRVAHLDDIRWYKITFVKSINQDHYSGYPDLRAPCDKNQTNALNLTLILSVVENS